MGLFKNQIRLNTTRSVQRLLQRVLNDLLLENSTIDTQKARAIIYGASILLKTCENIEIVERIENLEAMQSKGA